ncbi:hypothetical protein P879_11548 [Paragonimus westermani]|uniref:Reverse transcriptase domain-containing protein n=1 Tax=Paragonimus westermani TaxID=34504 RepID=A0A8T0DEI1_9TREM|nr:hypothetical protein P879_11548 [Paragonimus westermani]
MQDYRKEIFEMRSKRDNRPVAQKGYEWSVVAAFGSEEVRNALRNAAGMAPGVDKLLASEVLKWNLEAVAQLFNLLLVLGAPTSRLSLARLTFVLKVDEPATPADYRPIAVSSVLQRSELIDKLEGLDEGLRLTGIRLKNSKCRTLTIVKDRKRKHLVLFPCEYETLSGRIPCMEVDDTVRYPGLHFNWKGRLPIKSTVKAIDMLENLTEAPRKPYQRLEILKAFLISELKFELVMGNAHKNKLRKLDRLVRDKIRTWLRLPKDTTLAFTHSKIDGHGLGIPCLETTIPLEQRAKCERLVNSGTLEVANTVQSKAVVSDITVANVPIFVYGKPVNFKLEEDKAWGEALDKRALRLRGMRD